MQTLLRLSLTLGLLFTPINAQNLIHTVKSGDTLNKIAQTYNISIEDLINANQLVNPDIIEIDQEIIIPSIQSWNDPLPSPFSNLSLNPQTATQGEVQTLNINLNENTPLSITYLGQTIPTVTNGKQARALLATPVLQKVGQHSLVVTSQNPNGETTTLRLPINVQEGNYNTENINLSGTTSSLLSPDIVKREHALMENTCATHTQEQQWQGAFQHPIENPQFTSAFGTKRSYNNGPISGFHRGQDYRGQTGTPVYAAANGTVSHASSLELYGNTVILNHGLGVCSAYMHLNEIAITANQTLQTGDLLGYIGETGLVTGSHLHFEVRVNGVPVAPQQWIEGLE